MSTKKIKISDDGGTTYYTFPGNAGDITTDAGTINDTIFGFDYDSMQPGLIASTLAANGLYKGFAGYVAKLNMSGTPTAMTAEPCSLVSGKTYKVTSGTKQVLDPSAAISVLDNGVGVAQSNILNIDYLFGRVTFASAYTPTGPITITGNYLPLVVIARAAGFTLTQTMATVDDTDFAKAQANSGHRSYLAGQKTVSLALQGIYSMSNDWRTRLEARALLVIEIQPDGAGLSVARGFFKPTAFGQSGNVGAQEAATATFPLFVPAGQPIADALMAYPFGWLHASNSTLSLAIQKALTAWQNKLIYDYQYLYDGVNGIHGTGVITDITLAGGLEVMNDFSIKVALSDQLTSVP
jgi:hypothetical protein